MLPLVILRVAVAVENGGKQIRRNIIGEEGSVAFALL